MCYTQVCERLQKVLHIKPEDLRIYDFINEDQPDLLDNETMTLKDLNISDGHKILVESKEERQIKCLCCTCTNVHVQYL